MGFVGTPPEVFEDQRLAGLTDFRCQVCQGRYPYELHVDQDGADVCKPNCAYKYTPSETQLLAGEARSEAAQITSQTLTRAAQQLGDAPNHSLMDGVSACTRITSNLIRYPVQIPLVAGGSSAPFVLTGIAFTSADLLTASHTGITFGAAVIGTDLTTWTTTVVASGAVTKGDQDFLFNGTRFPKAFRVS